MNSLDIRNLHSTGWNGRTTVCSKPFRYLLLTLAILAINCVQISAQEHPAQKPSDSPAICPRGAEGSTLPEPEDLRSQQGVLRVELAFRSSIDASGRTNFCYVDNQGHQAPNLRLHPGDTLILILRNESSSSVSQTPSPAMPGMIHEMPKTKNQGGTSGQASSSDSCMGAQMTPLATNMHFHGLKYRLFVIRMRLCEQVSNPTTRLSNTASRYQPIRHRACIGITRTRTDSAKSNCWEELPAR